MLDSIHELQILSGSEFFKDLFQPMTKGVGLGEVTQGDAATWPGARPSAECRRIRGCCRRVANRRATSAAGVNWKKNGPQNRRPLRRSADRGRPRTPPPMPRAPILSRLFGSSLHSFRVHPRENRSRSADRSSSSRRRAAPIKRHCDPMPTTGGWDRRLPASRSGA